MEHTVTVIHRESPQESASERYFDYWSSFSKVMIKSQVYCFFETQCTTTLVLIIIRHIRSVYYAVQN